MKQTFNALTIFALIFCWAGTESSAEDSQGPKIFAQHKCQSCHSVKVLGIEVVKDVEEAEVVEEDEIKPGDLSGIGNRRTAEWLELYLRRKESVEGRKHKKRFKGSKNQRLALIAWLESLKQEAS